MRIASTIAPSVDASAVAPGATVASGGSNGVRSDGASVREVPAVKTTASLDEMKGAIGRAYQSLFGRAPSKSMLDTLTAQAALETGSGQKMYNFNFGGIKGASPLGETARYKTREVVDGKDIHIVDGFRSYRSLDDGARDFVSLLSRRYAGALSKADQGDTVGYAQSLKESGYFTAPASEYASGLTRLVGGLGGTTSPNGAAAKPEVTNVNAFALNLNHLPDTISITRFMDALDTRAADLASPVDDEA